MKGTFQICGDIVGPTGEAGMPSEGFSSTKTKNLHSDPVDRILVATARRLGVTLLTRDDKLLEYGSQGHAVIRSA